MRHTLFKRKDRNTSPNQQEPMGVARSLLAGLPGDTSI